MTPSPEVGMGATIDNWSEFLPVTVVEVKYFKSGPRKGEPSEVTVQLDDWKAACDGKAAYKFSRNAQGVRYAYIRNVNNKWVRKGHGGRGSKLILGHRGLSLQPEWLVSPTAP